MDFKQALGRSLAILKLDSGSVEETSRDDAATAAAFVMVLLAAIGAAVGLLLSSGDLFGSLFGIVGGFVGGVVGLFVGTAITWVVALLFGGKAGFMELLRPFGHAGGLAGALTGVLAGVPAVGRWASLLINLWLLVVSVVVVKAVYDFSTGKAVAVVLIPVVVLFLLALVFGMAMFAALGPGADLVSGALAAL